MTEFKQTLPLEKEHNDGTNADDSPDALLAKDEHTENSTFCSFNFVEG